ncbi:MAG: hypothetical protein PHS17_07360 [Desulfobacterales bacterium]|nr:hypothetical protein [Desulfobacterales bacterium]
MAQRKSSPVPGWVQRLLDLTWYEWLGWLLELGLLATFVVVIQTQFAEGEPRAGWIMILLTILLTGPGVWILLGYKPLPGSGFNKHDVGAIICFAIWLAIMIYLVGPTPTFEPGPFGNPGV